MDQSDLTGTTLTPISENPYSYFFSEPPFLATNFFYTLPDQRPRTTTNSTKDASVPKFSGDDPVNSWDPSGEYQCNGDPLTWIGCVGNPVQYTVNTTLKTVKSVVIDQVQKQIDEIRQFILDLKGLRSSQCSSSDLIPPCVTKLLVRVVDHLRLPDYITVDASIAGFGGDVGVAVTLDKYGSLFLTPEAGVSVPGASVQLRAGWIDQLQAPSRDYLNSFLNGNSVTGDLFGNLGILASLIDGVTYSGGISIAETWGNVGDFGLNDFATEIGVGYAEKHNASLTFSYSYHVADTGITW